MRKMNTDKEGNEYCFSYLPNGKGGFKIVKLYKNIKGYGELSKLPPFIPEEAVREIINSMNSEIGVTPQDEMQFVLGSLTLK